VYTLVEEVDESPLRDAKEFSTLLNSCGRLSKASLGIGVCLGDEKSKKRAIKNLTDYKKEIVKALKWYEGSKESKDVFREKGFMIINAKDEVLYTIIGTIASILSRSNDVEEGTYIMGLARTKEENNTKVSLRIGGKDEHEGVDLRQVVTDVVERVGFGEAGGHPLAAGAIIPFEKEEEFISAAKVVLRERVGKKVS
jgi:RecJ-like exonuclease